MGGLEAKKKFAYLKLTSNFPFGKFHFCLKKRVLMFVGRWITWSSGGPKMPPPPPVGIPDLDVRIALKSPERQYS